MRQNAYARGTGAIFLSPAIITLSQAKSCAKFALKNRHFSEKLRISHLRLRFLREGLYLAAQSAKYNGALHLKNDRTKPLFSFYVNNSEFLDIGFRRPLHPRSLTKSHKTEGADPIAKRLEKKLIARR